ncbi:MAG: iron-containing alcohol dehydrogenase [Bryobacteraceae bacterium]
MTLAPFDFHPRTRLIYGSGAIARLGALANELGFRRTLLVADPGIVEAGHASTAGRILTEAGIEPVLFQEFGQNPHSGMAEAGRAFASRQAIDSIIGLGGGSSMDCAKAINFLLTNGGTMKDYWGYGKASRPLLPMIGIPTTTGTGSEAQSYALISDEVTHVKMACGDPKASFRVAILDPELAVTQPVSVRAVAGYDALSHAVETFVTTKSSPISEAFSREAWRLLSTHYERAVSSPSDIEAVSGMQLGAFLAGLAIENSMLGATHACANPLTARYETPHGVAIASLLSHVVTWNQGAVNGRYSELHTELAARLRDLASAGGLGDRLRDLGIPENALPELADEAAEQWTGRFNPRPFDAAGALEIYRCAY